MEEYSRTSSSPIHIYAEYLNHIKAVSIQISTSTSTDTRTRATLLNGDQRIEVTHGAEHQRLILPARVVQPSNSAMILPDTPIKTLRLRVAESNNSPVAINIVPWTASSLSATAEFACASCKSVLVPRGKIEQWKDLPSEGWAEMMDFWHCHKPDESHTADDHQTSQKGYSAASQLVIEPGVGLLDATTMLLSTSDVQGVDTHLSSNIQICCSRCKAGLGSFESTGKAYRLSKSSLTSSTSTKIIPDLQHRQKWSACSLLTAMDTQGVRRFNVICQSSRQIAFSIWIFAPDLLISASNMETPRPLRMVKVMWKQINPEQALLNDQALVGTPSSTGMLELSYNDFAQLEQCLTEDESLLPSDARTFQDWNVALLPRFTEDDV